MPARPTSTHLTCAPLTPPPCLLQPSSKPGEEGSGAAAGSSMGVPKNKKIPWFGRLLGFCLVSASGAISGAAAGQAGL